jgi:hypothetical protein
MVVKREQGDARFFSAKGSYWPSRAFITLVVLVLFLSMGALAPSVHADNGTSATPNFHEVIMFQGDDPTTTKEEEKDRIWVVHRTAWSVPIESNVLYAYAPLQALNASVANVEALSHQGTSIFVPGPYSIAENPDNPPTLAYVTDGPYAGMYTWAFPEGTDRSSHASIVFSSQEDLEDYDPEATNASQWTIVDGSLRLAPGIESAVYTSKRYMAGTDIIGVNLTLLAEGTKENMTFEVTQDNGTTWHMVENATYATLDGVGYELRWRVTMTQDVAVNNTPLLDYAVVAVDFLEGATEVWLEMKYWLIIPKEGLEFNLWMPFDIDSSNLILLAYLDKDVRFDINGTSVIETPTETYPGKLALTHMVGPYSSTLVFDVKIQDSASPGRDDTATLIAVLIVLILASIVAIAYLKFRSPQVPVDGIEGEASDLDDVSRASDRTADREELMAEKAELMTAIKALDSELEVGMIGADEHEVRRGKLLDKTVDVMKQLDEHPED